MGRPHPDGLTLGDLEQPTLIDSGGTIPSAPAYLRLSPEKHLLHYDDVLWEEFVLEWATTVSPNYMKVMRAGGANDHGVDVAAFATSHGFEGDWDCFQCKHYGRALKPSDAYPEILKIVLGTLDGHYVWPRLYKFVAPQGYGISLANLINSPSKLREGLLALVQQETGTYAKSCEDRRAEVVEFIENADFSIFGTVELHDLIDQHSRTRWHSARFDSALPARPKPELPSGSPAPHEQRYIEELLRIYEECHGHPFTPSDAASHPEEASHYTRHRVAFYSAEALRAFARDSVPEGTFEALKDELFEGVVNTHDRKYDTGRERLSEVGDRACLLALTSNRLLPVVDLRDRVGMCQHLANDGKLSWVRG